MFSDSHSGLGGGVGGFGVGGFSGSGSGVGSKVKMVTESPECPYFKQLLYQNSKYFSKPFGGGVGGLGGVLGFAAFLALASSR